jgi:aryl-alcohol dehydrogenase-like predicted oxidoreductase
MTSPESLCYNLKMQQKILGNTGIAVSTLGLGTVKFGRNQAVKYPQAFEIPDDQHLIKLLHAARDLGINLIDTAPAYGMSEARLGTLLSGTRKDWVIVSKVGEEFVNGESVYNFTPEHAEKSIKRSLKQLHTDYIDVLLVHSDGNDVYNIQHFGILHFLSELKKQGLIRAFGMSTKTVEGGILALEKSDVVMVTYNCIETTEQPVIAKAFELNKGVLIKKALASGHIQKIQGLDPVKTSLQFILQEPGVSSIILGTINPEHLAHNVACIC